tara:strand:+ start:7655 stop:7792 length:138 start_codon:yes stop_codon:yes gene_type:complete
MEGWRPLSKNWETFAAPKNKRTYYLLEPGLAEVAHIPVRLSIWQL